MHPETAKIISMIENQLGYKINLGTSSCDPLPMHQVMQGNRPTLVITIPAEFVNESDFLIAIECVKFFIFRKHPQSNIKISSNTFVKMQEHGNLLTYFSAINYDEHKAKFLTQLLIDSLLFGLTDTTLWLISCEYIFLNHSELLKINKPFVLQNLEADLQHLTYLESLRAPASFMSTLYKIFGCANYYFNNRADAPVYLDYKKMGIHNMLRVMTHPSKLFFDGLNGEVYTDLIALWSNKLSCQGIVSLPTSQSRNIKQYVLPQVINQDSLPKATSKNSMPPSVLNQKKSTNLKSSGILEEEKKKRQNAMVKKELPTHTTKSCTTRKWWKLW